MSKCFERLRILDMKYIGLQRINYCVFFFLHNYGFFLITIKVTFEKYALNFERARAI